MAENLVERIVHWSLLAVTAIYLVSGIGITEYRTVELLTFGLLTKNLSFAIHTNLGIPFLVLLVIHVFIKPLSRAYTRLVGRA